MLGSAISPADWLGSAEGISQIRGLLTEMTRARHRLYRVAASPRAHGFRANAVQPDLLVRAASMPAGKRRGVVRTGDSVSMGRVLVLMPKSWAQKNVKKARDIHALLPYTCCKAPLKGLFRTGA
jgi:hypothetical protein